RAAVGSRQVAEVVDPGIVGIGNLDYVRHGGHSPILLHPTVARSHLTRITCGGFRFGRCTAPAAFPLWSNRWCWRAFGRCTRKGTSLAFPAERFPCCGAGAARGFGRSSRPRRRRPGGRLAAPAAAVDRDFAVVRR